MNPSWDLSYLGRAQSFETLVATVLVQPEGRVGTGQHSLGSQAQMMASLPPGINPPVQTGCFPQLIPRQGLLCWV